MSAERSDAEPWRCHCPHCGKAMDPATAVLARGRVEIPASSRVFVCKADGSVVVW